MNVAPISFCNKLAFNVRDDKYKTSLLKKVFNKFNIIVTDNSCQIYNKKYASLISKSKYLLSTNTKGNRYFLYFTRDEFDNNLCFFIDRKICKGYQYPRIIYTKYRFDDVVFKDTLIYGELIKDYENNWIFLVNDILSYCGKKCFRDDKLKRIQYMYNLFNNFYIRDPILDVCNFQIKRYFEYKQFDYLVNNFIPNLKYKINGIMFNSLTFKKPNILLLKHFKTKYIQTNNKSQKKSPNLFEINSNNDNQQQEQPKLQTQAQAETIISKVKTTIDEDTLLNKQYFNFIIERTNQGIFQLTCFINQNKKIFGYARTNLKLQKQLLTLLNSEKYKDKDLMMKCKYNKKFKKFVPIEESNVIEPDQYIDIKQYIKII